jgi:formylglycine-generating enzyme required for sulfatase activity
MNRQSRSFLVTAAVVALCSGEPGTSNAGSGSQAGPASPIDVTTKSGVAMVYLPGGEFTMGSNQGTPDEAPPHRVKVGGFLMDKFEVTHELFRKVQLPNPSHWQDTPKKPVERVRWRDAKQYCNERSLLEGLKPCYNEKTLDWDCDYAANGYRLPTEAEWEYACRAGTTTAYSFGDDPAQLGDYGWFFDNSDSKYQEVGKKKPNPWGLYDMHGNVTEWVLDQFDPDFYKVCAGKGVVTDPWNKATKPYPHSVRGGSWDEDPPALRSGARNASDRTWKMQDPQLPKSIWYLTDAKIVGFRIVRPLQVPTAEELAKYWTSGVEKE